MDCDNIGCEEPAEFLVVGCGLQGHSPIGPGNTYCRRHLDHQAADPWDLVGLSARAILAIHRWRAEARRRNRLWLAWPRGAG